MTNEWTSPDGRIRLINADCLEVLPQLEAGSVDCVIADPPYAIPTIVASCRETTRTIGDLSLIEAAFRTVFHEMLRVVSDAGRLFVFCDGTSYPVVFRAAYGRMSTALIVWDKGRIGMGREFRKSHELIMHGWRPGTPIFADGVGRADVIRCSPVGDERLHDAQKPAELIQELLTVCGAIVLDPFMGSGTSCIAAIRTGREFIGCEIDPGTFDLAVSRVKAELARTRLFEPQPPKQLELLEAVA